MDESQISSRNTKTIRTPTEAKPGSAPSPQCKLCLATDMGTSIRQGNDWYCETCASKAPTTSNQLQSVPKKKCSRCLQLFRSEDIRKVGNDSRYYCVACIEQLKQQNREKKEAKQAEQAKLDAKALEKKSAGDKPAALNDNIQPDKHVNVTPGGGELHDTATANNFPQPTNREISSEDNQRYTTAHSTLKPANSSRSAPEINAVCYGCSKLYSKTDLRNVYDKEGKIHLVCIVCFADYKEHVINNTESGGYNQIHSLLGSEKSSHRSSGGRSTLSKLSAQRRKIEEEFFDIERNRKAKELMVSIEEEEEELKRRLEETQLKKASLAKLCGISGEPPTRVTPGLTTVQLNELGGRSISGSQKNATIQEWISDLQPVNRAERIVSDNDPIFSANEVRSRNRIDQKNLYAEPNLRWEDLDILRNTILEEPALCSGTTRRPTRETLEPRSTNFFQDMDRTINETGAAAVTKVRTLLPEQLVARKYLPKELPSFNGDPAEWPKFISAYIETQAHCNYSNRENIMRLRPALKGEAYRLVEDLLSYPDNLECIMSSLKAMYGNPERIRQAISKKLRALPSIKQDDLSSITWMANKIRGFCSTLRAAQLERDLFNSDYLAEIEEKLPVHLRVSWGIFKMQSSECNLNTIATWLASIGAATVTLGKSQPFHNSSKGEQSGKSPGERIHVHLSLPKTTELKCFKCEGKHQLADCGDYQDLNVNERWNLAVVKRLCFKCLQAHNYNRCKNKEVCGVDGCTRKHHKLLHKKETTPDTTIKAEAIVTLHQEPTSDVLFRIVPIKLYGPTKELITYAFLDEGSSVTLLEEELMKELEVGGSAEQLCLRWTGSTTRTEDSFRVSIGISTISDRRRMATISDVRTVKSLDLPIQTLTKKTFNLVDEFSGIPIPTYNQAKPKILVGLAHWKLAVPMEYRSSPGGLIATRSKLGWAVSGLSRTATTDQIHFHECGCREIEVMESLLRRYFEMECYGIQSPEKPLESSEISRARRVLQETVKMLDRRYEIGLLWKGDGLILPDSKPMAIRRHLCLERRLKNDVTLYDEMRRQMDEYLTKGYSRLLTTEEENCVGPRTWYLPIFVVTNPNKPGKIRVVWDAAAKTNGVSLNDHLLAGPDMLSGLPDVLRRFREYKVAVTGDIAEMFHQVWIRKEDRDAQRFLWRREPEDELRTFEMTVMTFGATCSPCEAQFVKNLNARRYQHEFPEAVSEIIENHYVDDFVSSFKDEESAKTITEQIRMIQSNAGFILRKFSSNSCEVLRHLQEEISIPEKDLIMGEGAESKVLGMRWDTAADELHFRINWDRIDSTLVKGERKPTKREVLRHLMTVFDPLGLLSHILVQLKLLLQDVHRSTKGWDEQITDEQEKRWRWWIDAVKNLEVVRIPRCYSLNLSSDDALQVDLHVFVDASERVYAAVSYIRVHTTYDIQCSLVGAKTKLAPTKPISIPRLELQAAVLGVRLGKSIVEGHRLKFNRIIYWSDSINVLCWIKSEHRNFKQFVGFRVGEILETSHAEEWRYVPSKCNIADVCTKLKLNIDFESIGPWFKAPNFLYQREENWPAIPKQLQTTEPQEFRSLHVGILPPKSTASPDASRISKWSVLLRCQARVLRWLRNIRSPRNDNYSPEELEEAELELIRSCQRDVFGDEIALLRNDDHTALPRLSPLRNLTPFFDPRDGILRMRSRIQRAQVGYQMKNPAILPKGHPMTRVMIWEYHRRFFHGYHETVCNEIRQRYFVPHLRVEIKTVVSKCPICIMKRARPKIPIMADLPDERLAANTRPFSYVGLDYFGPIDVAVGRSTKKYWGVLMTCLTTRACHLDLTSSLRSDEAIMVIDRFISRRGEPMEICCDNATSFKGVDSELENGFGETDWSMVSANYFRIQFKYITPAAPHMGGCWERLIRSVKSTLRTILKSHKPNVEVLTTALCQIENILNSRPLTYKPINEDAVEALTPNHLLIGQSNAVRPMGALPDRTTSYGKQWQRAIFIAQAFWVRWVKEYLPTLSRRTKWFDPVKPLKVGDVGVIWDPSRKNSWQLGRIVHVCEATRDRQVRTIEIQTATGIYKRPVSKFAKFDIGEPAQNDHPHEGGNVANGKKHSLISDISGNISDICASDGEQSDCKLNHPLGDVMDGHA